MTGNRKQSQNNGNDIHPNKQDCNRKRSKSIDERYRKDFKFHCRPYSNTVDGVLITYLQQGDEVRSSKEMVLQALRMCWLPLAYKAQVNTHVGIHEQEVYRVTLICCHALEQHLAYLRMELGLPHKPSDVLPVNLNTIANHQHLDTMFNLDTVNSNKNVHESNQSEVSSNNQIDSDSFIPGIGSFHDDTNDMFGDI